MPPRVSAVDHVGYVVTDLDQAVRFFIDVLGFEDAERRGELNSSDGDRMTRLFGVEPAARGRYVFVRLGDMRVELLAWTAPDQNSAVPKNSDLGGRHLALAVPNMDEFLPLIASHPGCVLRERNQIGFYYLSTPFGLEIQLIPG